VLKSTCNWFCIKATHHTHYYLIQSEVTLYPIVTPSQMFSHALHLPHAFPFIDRAQKKCSPIVQDLVDFPGGQVTFHSHLAGGFKVQASLFFNKARVPRASKIGELLVQRASWHSSFM